MKKISIVSSCYNEEDNLDELYNRVSNIWSKYSDKYEFEYILLDNDSKDGTECKLRELAEKDKRVKVILNSRNFGQINSPFWGLKNVESDAAILIASDLQDPPELITDLIKKWEEGCKIVFLKKDLSKENKVIFLLRNLYYKFLKLIADNGVELAENCTGSGLFDKVVIDVLKQVDDPNPYLRGLICEVGFKRAYINFEQPIRKKGVSCNNFYSLYSIAMSGITKFSKLPLRMMTIMGFIISAITFITSIFYLILKLKYWDVFSFGIAPIILSILFLGSVQLFCIGILGEYIAAVYSRVDKKPLVIERERINF